MTKYQLLFTCFLFISYATFGQQKVKGEIEDAETGAIVSFATVSPEKGEPIVSDSSGKFSITIKKQTRLNDSILVSAVGYSSKKILTRDLLTKHKIQLERNDKVLEQVKVFASIRGDHQKFGYYRNWKVKNDGGEIGYIFDFPWNTISVGQVQVKINHNYDTCWLKLHLRNASTSGFGLPENELLQNEIILPVTTRYGMIEFDLNWLPVDIPSKRLYAGFELLKCGCSESSAPSFFFMGNEEGKNYYRESGNSIWKMGGDYTIYVRMSVK